MCHDRGRLDQGLLKIWDNTTADTERGEAGMGEDRPRRCWGRQEASSAVPAGGSGVGAG